MKKVAVVPLEEVLFFQEGPGVRKNQYTTAGVKLLNVSNLVDGKIDLSNSNRYISEEEANVRYNHFLVDEGDLIIASSGIKVEYFDKKIGFVERKHLPLCMNTSTIRFKSLNKDLLSIDYFYFYLTSNHFKNQLSKLITGSAQLNFGPSHLKKVKVLLPDIEMQDKIVKNLKKLDEVVLRKREQLSEYDTLVKSRYSEEVVA